MGWSVECQNQLLAAAVRRLEPGSSAQGPAVLVTAVIAQLLVHRHDSLEQRGALGAVHSGNGQAGTWQLDDPTADMRIALVAGCGNGRRQGAADGRRFEDVGQLLAVAQQAQVAEARLRVGEHIEVEFDALYAGTIQLDRLAESPCRHVERAAPLLNAGKHFWRAVVRVAGRWRKLEG